MKPSTWMTAGALLAAVGVGVGAFGAHGLPEYLRSSHALSDADVLKRLDQFETGVRYHLWHAIGIVVAGVLMQLSGAKIGSLAPWLFTAGIVLFSGMLYALVVSNQPKLGAIVPLGGLAYIAGWLALAVAAWRHLPEP